MARTVLPPILTTTNSILRNISCEMDERRVISGFKRVVWPELRRLPLGTSSDRPPASIKQVGSDIEREANSIIKKHGLQFEDEEDRCDPQMEMRGVPGKSGTSVPTILILAPWSIEKQRDWERAAQEMAMFLAGLSRVSSFGEREIHVEIIAPELVQPTYYANIDDPVYQSAWERLSGTIFSHLQSLRATQGHITCLSLQKYGTDDGIEDNPPTVYISVDHDSDETQWPEVIGEVKKTLAVAEWDHVQVHIEHNQGMVGYFDNFTSPARERRQRAYRLRKRLEGDYYSTVHIGDGFGAARDIKRTDGKQLSPANGTVGCFVQLKTSGPDPTWRTFILTSYQAVRPAFDSFAVTPDGTGSIVAPPTANSDLWTVDSYGYTPDSTAKPAALKAPLDQSMILTFTALTK